VLFSIVRLLRRIMPVFVAAIAVAGCDPCAGVSCSTTPRVTLTGTIVNHATGIGVPGTRVSLHVTDAGGQTADASTTTDGGGVWQASTKLQTSGKANAVVTVAAPNAPAYSVTLPVDASTKAGVATGVGFWTEVPSIRLLISVVVSSQPLVNGIVHFRQTSGPTVIDSKTDGTTSGDGVFELDFATQTLGAVVGDLTITHPSLLSPIVVPGLSIQIDYHFGIPLVMGTIIR
jgi:hypothetical protein